MSLATQQATLARLYTDAVFRERFFSADSGEDEAHAEERRGATELDGFSRDQVLFFARSLQRKRLREVRELLPRTSAALGEGLPDLFFRFARTYTPHGIAKHRTDAMRFVAYLVRTAHSTELAPWIKDIARYEATWLQAREPRFFFALKMRRRGRDGTIEGGRIHEDASGRSTLELCCWFRWSAASRLRFWAIALFPGRMVERLAATIAARFARPRRSRIPQFPRRSTPT